MFFLPLSVFGPVVGRLFFVKHDSTRNSRQVVLACVIMVPVALVSGVTGNQTMLFALLITAFVATVTAVIIKIFAWRRGRISFAAASLKVISEACYDSGTVCSTLRPKYS